MQNFRLLDSLTYDLDYLGARFKSLLKKTKQILRVLPLTWVPWMYENMSYVIHFWFPFLPRLLFDQAYF
jgi:hypothetical protein